MGSASNGSSQVISVPKGGGALHGIGEKFSPDLFTGTGNFTVPIALPQYSTGNGNGPFGLGWSLTRNALGGLAAHPWNDAKDTFILSGAEDLVPVEKKEITTRFRPRTEGLFARWSIGNLLKSARAIP
jgi:hypothetical protein